MQKDSPGLRHRRLSQLWFALLVGLVAAVVAPASALATLSTQTITAVATPSTQNQAAFGGSSLSLAEDETYTSGFTPTLSKLVYHLDNDFVFDATGLPQCPLSSIVNFPRATAIAACPESVVGFGSAQFFPGPHTGVVTPFNGETSGGMPTIYLHVSIDNDAVDFVIVGDLGPSSRGGDFGTQISLAVPPTGLALTHLDFTLLNLEPAPGHHYLGARCNDADHVWDFAADATYSDLSTRLASATETCAATTSLTGQRAAALKKCKKKKPAKARRKCRKRAKRLPV
jgi:hypothetical protein